MAFFDDPDFIISHIRNSYITSDDTGMCEVVIVDEGLPSKPRKTTYHESSDSSEDSADKEVAHSFDIVSDMDLGAHRRRSNTAQRLDRLKKERQNQALIKHIQWKDNSESPPGEILEQLFQKKDLSGLGTKKFASLLSEQLNEQPNLPNNPFSEYAKFDGMASIGIPTKKIKIFLTMLPQAQRAYPLPVVVIATAKVRELIGLICWQYTNEKREPKLRDNIDCYGLHIAEDDGEVDMDFPSLDSKEVISKFGFSVLALVERGSPSMPHNKVNLTIRFPGEQPISISADSITWTVREVMEKAIAKQWGRSQYTFANEYWLERQSNPGVKLNSNSTLASLNCTDFRLVKSNRKVSSDKSDWPLSGMAAMEAPLYQSYVVSLLSRVRPKTGIHLGISGEKIELDPVQHKGSAKLWSRAQKPVSYDMDSIASCDITEVKSTGKSVFRLIYVSSQGHDYKHHDFESDSSAANEIVQKINNILEMHSSTVHRDYLMFKERKAQQRRSFNLGK